MGLANVLTRCAGALLLVVLAGCSQSVPLYSSLTEQQANEVEAALKSSGIDARKLAAESGSWAIEVPGGRVAQAMEVLHAQGLPARRHKTMGELFKKEGFVSSPIEQRARYLFALAQELERTLTAIDGVLEARVHLALPEKKPLEKDTAGGGSASVVLIHRPGAALEQRETSIRAIVTDGLERITDPNRVTVQLFERAAAQLPPQEDEGLADDRLVLAGSGALGGMLLAGVAGAIWWSTRRGRGAADTGGDGSRAESSARRQS